MIKLKKKVALLLSLTLLLTFSLGTLTTAGAAETRASSYFSSYTVDVYKNSNGTLSVEFNVKAVSTMASLGAQSIIIQKYNSSTDTWSTYSVFYSSTYTTMLGSNTTSHIKTMTTSSSVSSGKYRAYITFYAKNSSGSENKYYTSSSVTVS